MFLQLFEIIAPVFICTAIGFVWTRLGRPYDTDLVSALVLHIGTPCLVFATLTKTGLKPDAFAEMALGAFSIIAVALAVCWALLKALGLSQRAYLPPLIMPNTGNMGLALSAFAFGDAGLALGIAVFTVVSVAQFTLGLGIAAGTYSVRQVVRMPLIYAIAAALGFLYAGVSPPVWILTTTGLIGGLTIPLLLITLGISLGKIQVTGLRRALPLGLARLGLGFGIGLGVAEALGLEGMARSVLILHSAMPVAVFNYLFAQTYDAEPEDVAGMVMISTTASFATLPLLLLYLL